jgi:hypothetical protein
MPDDYPERPPIAYSIDDMNSLTCEVMKGIPVSSRANARTFEVQTIDDSGEIFIVASPATSRDVS